MNSGTAAAQKVAVYRDFASGYTLVDRVGMSVEVVQHVLGASRRPVGARGLYAYGRSGGTVTNPAALRWLEISS